MALAVGEVSAYDQGWNGRDSRDTTQYKAVDKAWLVRTAKYLKDMAAASNQGLSYFFWCFNANSHDTKVSVECSAQMQATGQHCCRQGATRLDTPRACARPSEVLPTCCTACADHPWVLFGPAGHSRT